MPPRWGSAPGAVPQIARASEQGTEVRSGLTFGNERSILNTPPSPVHVLQLHASGDDAVVAHGLAVDGVAGLDAGQVRAFRRALDDHLARAGGNGRVQQFFFVCACRRLLAFGGKVAHGVEKQPPVFRGKKTFSKYCVEIGDE